MMTRNDLAVVKWYVLPPHHPEASMALQALISCFFNGIMFCYHVLFNHVSLNRYCSHLAHRLLESSIRCSSYHGQKAISVIFDNLRVPRLAPVVLVLRYRLASDSPGKMHYNICSLNDPFRYQSSFNHSPVVLELRYRLALNSLGSLP